MLNFYKFIIFSFKLEKLREVSTPAGLSNSITILENKKSNLESRLEILRAEMSELTNEHNEIRVKSESFSRQIQQLTFAKEKEVADLSDSDKALLENLQVHNSKYSRHLNVTRFYSI